MTKKFMIGHYSYNEQLQEDTKAAWPKDASLMGKFSAISVTPSNNKKEVKPNLALVPGTFMIHVAKALEDGANKHGPYNWRQSKVSIMNLLSKIERHLQLYKDRHDNADDSGLNEIAHAAADCAVLLDAMESKTLIDDRPENGNINDLMKRYTK